MPQNIKAFRGEVDIPGKILSSLGYRVRRLFLAILLILVVMMSLTSVSTAQDIVFVTQPPLPRDFATVNATFGNHTAELDSVPRGGDLYIRYSDGSLKNLTAAAGYGTTGFQGANGIAVRDPAVHWSGEKILFSMVIGAPTRQYQVESYRWQLYEITGLSKLSTPVISKVVGQPVEYNNVMAVYGSNDQIIFVSDKPPLGLEHTYPQRDEYESTATNTGIWSLNPGTGEVIQLDHSPSGDFNPVVDSFGRVVFTRWDHLQRDQQNRCSQASFGAFNYSSESASAIPVDEDNELFPEARALCDRGYDPSLDRHTFNSFLPWQVREDGRELETLNHIGRHELEGYLGKSFNDDPNVEEFYGQYTRENKVSISSFHHITEDPVNPGLYYAVSSPEFGTHASGQLFRILLPPHIHPDKAQVESLTHPDTQTSDSSPSLQHTGLSRDPAPLSNGSLLAAHSGSTLEDTNIGTTEFPQSRYQYRLRYFRKTGDYYVPDQMLTGGITKSISFWSPDVLVSYVNATMWELQPQEVRVRPRPQAPAHRLPSPELSVFHEKGIVPEDFERTLRDNNLALIVARNVTTRDSLDRQQPFNLQVEGSQVQTIGSEGKLYSVAHMQLFQGDLIRGYGGVGSPTPGRRILAQPLHSTKANIPNLAGPEGSVIVAADGSVAALVPARRPISYQLTDVQGKPVVRERLWLTFQPGEVRVCGSCHGVNTIDQAGQSPPENAPAALGVLLDYVRNGITDTPQMGLSAVSRTNKRGASFLALTVSSKTTSSRGKRYSLLAQANGVSCGEVITNVLSEQGVSKHDSKRLPNFGKKYTINFQLQSQGAVMAEAVVKLAKKRRKRVLPTRVCSLLKKAFVE